MIVDIHAHYFAKEYIDRLMSIGGRSVPEAARALTAGQLRRDDVSGIAARLSQMDEAEVQMQVLSPAASPPYAERSPTPSRRRGSSTIRTPSSPRNTPGGSTRSSRCRCRTSMRRCARWSAGWTSSACSGCR
jgi:hypothetical protein